jgi:hypothetical protein
MLSLDRRGCCLAYCRTLARRDGVTVPRLTLPGDSGAIARRTGGIVFFWGVLPMRGLSGRGCRFRLEQRPGRSPFPGDRPVHASRWEDSRLLYYRCAR